MYKKKYLNLKLKYLQQYGSAMMCGQNICPICDEENDSDLHRLIILPCCGNLLCLKCINNICDIYNNEVVERFSNYNDNAEEYIKHLQKPSCPFCKEELDCSKTDHNFIQHAFTVPSIILNRAKLIEITGLTEEELQQIDYLNLNDQNISQIDDNTFAGLSNLKNVILRNNKITNITHSTFNGLTSLIALVLSDNHINSIDINAFNDTITSPMIHIKNNPIQNPIINNKNINFKLN